MRSEIALKNEILRGHVGHTVHGINIGGRPVRDELGIFIEPPENVCGISPCDPYVYRTQPEGVPNRPGDLDLTLYSLREFAHLAARGEPNAVILLCLPEYANLSPLGKRLVLLRSAFVGREAGERFLSHLFSQRIRMIDERTKRISRPELVKERSFDTILAMNALRIGFAGIEYITQGTITIPIAEPNLTTLHALRNGEIPYEDTLQLIRET